MGAVLSGADKDFRIKLTFAACTGVRAGEQWAVRWRDVDLETGHLHVGRRVDAYREEGVPKSAAGVRNCSDIQPVHRNVEGMETEVEIQSADDLIFPNEEGNHTSHDNLVKRCFNPLFGALDAAHRLDPTRVPHRPVVLIGMRFDTLRVDLDRSGFAPKTVQTFAGHASLQVTMDRYGHLFPSDDHKKAMDQIAKGLFA